MLIETIPIIIEFSLLFLITLVMLLRYAAKSISPYIILINFISWFLCFVIIVLVPLDVYFVSFQSPDSPNFPILVNSSPRESRNSRDQSPFNCLESHLLDHVPFLLVTPTYYSHILLTFTQDCPSFPLVLCRSR